MHLLRSGGLSAFSLLALRAFAPLSCHGLTARRAVALVSAYGFGPFSHDMQYGTKSQMLSLQRDT